MSKTMSDSRATRSSGQASHVEMRGSRQPARQRQAEVVELGAATLAPAALAEKLAALGPRPRAEALLDLQRAVGNASVQRALAQAPTETDGQTDDLAGRILAASSGGEAPDASARAELEASLGVDLGEVRVHHDREADSLAQAVDAVAFTSGQDIFFAESAYDPQSPRGRRLLAHEVAHTVQQAAGPVPGTPAPGGISLSDPEDDFEQAASSYAEWHGSAAPAYGSGPAAGAAVQRDGDYPWSGPVVDAASSVLWDIGGAIPGVGTITNFAGLAIDAGKYGIDTLVGDEASANKRLHEMELDAAGMVPGVGTYLGGASLATDVSALMGRGLSDKSAEEAPTFGELWDKILNTPAGPEPMEPNYGGSGAGAQDPNAGAGGAGGGGGEGGAPGYYPEEQY
ncbi:MAG: DUF4157 domain-containing protein [Dehalococcoidales bacterium]|nr:DUF4157 domain-containing protein [Dehalococcoidales bacterium]